MSICKSELTVYLSMSFSLEIFISGSYFDKLSMTQLQCHPELVEG